ncbi:hypothetical protein CLAIMM_14513 [Cladophialophora immunda]|nr:hypothetical protein CLAIMM_14513 [Cladophialophora immunda]
MSNPSQEHSSGEMLSQEVFGCETGSDQTDLPTISRRISTIDGSLPEHSWKDVDEDEFATSLRLIDSFGMIVDEDEFQELWNANSSRDEEAKLDPTQARNSNGSTANEREFLNLMDCDAGGRLCPVEKRQSHPASPPIPGFPGTDFVNPWHITKSTCTMADKQTLPNANSTPTTMNERSQQGAQRRPKLTPTSIVNVGLDQRGEAERPPHALQTRPKRSRLWVSDAIFLVQKKSFTDAIVIPHDGDEDESTN